MRTRGNIVSQRHREPSRRFNETPGKGARAGTTSSPLDALADYDARAQVPEAEDGSQRLGIAYPAAKRSGSPVTTGRIADVCARNWACQRTCLESRGDGGARPHVRGGGDEAEFPDAARGMQRCRDGGRGVDPHRVGAAGR